jgi:hypothetical protein
MIVCLRVSLGVLLLPPHEEAAQREKRRVNRTPGEEDTKVQSDPRMQIK